MSPRGYKDPFNVSQLIETALRAACRPRALALPVLLAAVAITACGDDVSPGAVARVGDSTIEKSEFDHWLEAAALTQQTALAPGGAQEAVVPTPPDFTECVEAKEEQAGAAGGQNAPEPPPAEELRQQCEEEYDLLKEQVMQFLIQAEAVEQEAEERGVSVSDEEVSSQFEDLKQQSFPSDEQFEQFLEDVGHDRGGPAVPGRLDLLISEIREDVIAEGGDVTDEEIEAYYEENKEEAPIGQPEQREVQRGRDRDRGGGRRGSPGHRRRRQVRRRSPRSSRSTRLQDRGGQLTFRRAPRRASSTRRCSPPSRASSPARSRPELGFYVFEVTDVQEAETQPLEEAREAIVQILQAQQEQEALTDFQGSSRPRSARTRSAPRSS